MNIKEPKTIRLTQKEYDSLDANAKGKLKYLLAKNYSFESGVWTFWFYGITDKQIATELCADFGLKVEE